MIKRLCSLVAIAAVGGALLAGCGSSSSSSSSSSSAAPAASTSSSASSGGSTSVPAALSTAVASCKSTISRAPNLSEDAKNKLEGLCNQAASGNGANLKKTEASVCQQIVKDTVPSSAQAAALAACPKS